MSAKAPVKRQTKKKPRKPLVVHISLDGCVSVSKINKDGGAVVEGEKNDTQRQCPDLGATATAEVETLSTTLAALDVGGDVTTPCSEKKEVSPEVSAPCALPTSERDFGGATDENYSTGANPNKSVHDGDEQSSVAISCASSEGLSMIPQAVQPQVSPSKAVLHESEQPATSDSWEDITDFSRLQKPSTSTNSISNTGSGVRKNAASSNKPSRKINTQGQVNLDPGLAYDSMSPVAQAALKSNAPVNLQHILSLYDISPSTTHAAIDEVLAPYKNFGYRIKWVDDNHAALYFRAPAFADHALKNLEGNGVFKLRRISEADEKTLSTIDTVPRYLTGEKPRPFATNTSVAKRLIGASLHRPDIYKSRSTLDSTSTSRATPQHDSWGEDETEEH
ncbi:hypothetical protein Pelo_2427 [Pelomyxa schiedti]|nr:hypothetical protein Pelo_2427 [Pelomyxa schiedti]